ncbi:MAG: hypothetical protein HZC40_21845 [Chloroflexi bacterium]|nr:hypothetical protein [Chloroflexota bacterium]
MKTSRFAFCLVLVNLLVGCATPTTLAAPTSNAPTPPRRASEIAPTQSAPAQVQAGVVETIDTLAAKQKFDAYTHLAVNNSTSFARDAQNRLRMLYTDQTGALTLLTQSTDGKWTRAPVPTHTSSPIKTPALKFDNGKLYAAWIEEVAGAPHLEFAEGGIDAATGQVTWARSHIGEVALSAPQNAIKFLTFAVTGAGKPILAVTEGNPDIYAHVFTSTGKLQFSPLNSGLGKVSKSSDPAIAADKQLAVIAWEENWAGLGAGREAHLLMRLSRDGGQTWDTAKNLLASGETLGGDPSVCIAGDALYATWQQTVPINKGAIFAARLLPGMSQFELITFAGQTTPGKIGDGWLPNIDCAPSRIAISWEHTTGEYFAKEEHAIATAYLLDANTTPRVVYGTLSNPAPTNASFDLNSHILLSTDGARADVFWVTVAQKNQREFTLTLKHRVDQIK